MRQHAARIRIISRMVMILLKRRPVFHFNRGRATQDIPTLIEFNLKVLQPFSIHVTTQSWPHGAHLFGDQALNGSRAAGHFIEMNIRAFTLLACQRDADGHLSR
jgi:hypothetical protein